MFYEILSKISDWFVNDVRLTLDWSHLSGSVTSVTIDDDPEFFENNRVPSCIVGLWSVNIHQYQELFREHDNDRRNMYLPWHNCVEDHIHNCVSYILHERPTRGNSHLKIGSAGMLVSKRYQCPVLWAWFKFFNTTSRCQFLNSTLVNFAKFETPIKMLLRIAFTCCFKYFQILFCGSMLLKGASEASLWTFWRRTP